MTANFTFVTSELRGVLTVSNQALRYRPAGAADARGSGKRNVPLPTSTRR